MVGEKALRPLRLYSTDLRKSRRNLAAYVCKLIGSQISQSDAKSLK
jgi:hypothetical protein